MIVLVINNNLLCYYGHYNNENGNIAMKNIFLTFST